MLDCEAMKRLWLKSVFRADLLRFALFRIRWRQQLVLHASVSPNLRRARIRCEPGGRVEIGPGFATERQAGNHLWLESNARLRLGKNVWLRTEMGENRIHLFPGARVEIGDGSLINGAMLNAKSEIHLGTEAFLGFGVRVFDADLHPLDSRTPERIEPVRIGDRVWVGCDVVVLRGVTIGNDVVIGAGSVVTHDLPSNVLAVGAPAHPVRELASRVGCS